MQTIAATFAFENYFFAKKKLSISKKK